jgi:hypothetical protein
METWSADRLRGGVVDPIALVVTALAAGAGAGLGLQGTASAAVLDVYAGLKAAVRKRLSGRRDGGLVLARHEAAPETWAGRLAAELAAAGTASDGELVAAAQALISLVDAAGSRAGKYVVDVRGSQGVQVGDHTVQHNTFGTPTGR